MSLNVCDVRPRWLVSDAFAGLWPVFAFAQFRPTLGSSLTSSRGLIRRLNAGNATDWPAEGLPPSWGWPQPLPPGSGACWCSPHVADLPEVSLGQKNPGSQRMGEEA